MLRLKVLRKRRWKMRKEINVYGELKTWFNSYNIDCWLNQGNDKFIVKGSRKKPDLVIYSPNLNQYIVIEVKSGKRAKEVFDASKILDYYEDYIKGKTNYYINKKKIKVSSFTVATLFSMFGKLIKDEKEPLSIEDYKGDIWRRINKERGLEPRWEYPRTHDFLRHLWADWRKIRKKRFMPGVGIILSDTLNQTKRIFSNGISTPILFDIQWEISRWKVRQKWL